MMSKKNNITAQLLPCALCLTFLLSGCSSILSLSSDGPIHPNPGKRTLGTMINDEQTETLAAVNLDKASPDLASSNISITSFNGVVLLTGQVASSTLRQLAGKTVDALPKVRQVHNELQIQGTTSLLARTNDSWLTSKVKTRLLADNDISAGRIKVVTESGVVYLMGLLSRFEVERATSIASTTSGVQKVVTAVEYIN